MTEREQLAQLGYRLAQKLDDRGVLEAGIVRQLARAVLEQHPAPQEQPGGVCRRCATPLVQPTTGRPRIWCSDRCRKGRTKPAERPS